MFNPDNCPPSRRPEDPMGSTADSRRGLNRDRGEKEAVAPRLKGKKTRGRVKIPMTFIKNKLRRCTTFSKRKTGIMKKANELATLTGTQVLLLVTSETGHLYTNVTYKLRPMITSAKGKALIETCLRSEDPSPLHYDASTDPRISIGGFEEPPLTSSQQPTASEMENQGHAKDADFQLTFNEGSLPGTSNVQSMAPTTPSALQGSGVQQSYYLQPVTAGSNYSLSYPAIVPEWFLKQQYRPDQGFTYSQGSSQLQQTHPQAQDTSAGYQGYLLNVPPPGSVQNSVPVMQEDPMVSGWRQP